MTTLVVGASGATGKLLVEQLLNRGVHVIRINDQYRVCFEWNNGNTENVEVVDYHR